LTGCKTTAPTYKIDAAVHSNKDVIVNAQRARQMMWALVKPLSGAIVEGADGIKEGTTDRAIRREALLFKIEAVPALREALLRPNPYAAVFDAWVLSLQLIGYFETGKGREALGDAAPVAIATCQYLESQIHDVAAALTRSGDVSNVHKLAGEVAADYPILHSISSRKSTLALGSERNIKDRLSTMEAAGSLIVTMDDLSRRLEIYSAQLPDEIRWHSELFALDMSEDLLIEETIPLAQEAVRAAVETMTATNRLIPSIEKALATMQSAPEMISRERIAALDSLHQELTHTLRFMQQERISILTHITNERLAVLTDLHETITSERQALSDEMEEIGRGVVDHAFLRAAQLTAVVLILLFIGILVLLILANRIFSRHPKDSRGSTAAP
jgi:hypothetical protein